MTGESAQAVITVLFLLLWSESVSYKTVDKNISRKITIDQYTGRQIALCTLDLRC